MGGNDSDHSLDRELRTFDQYLHELIGQLGKFALVHEDTVINVYDKYADAVKIGYAKFKLEPFMVKQIAQSEQILSFTRDFDRADDNS